MTEAAQACIGGFHAVEAALGNVPTLRRIWLAEGRDDARARGVADEAVRQGVPVERAPMARLDELLPEVRHQGCVAECEIAQPRRESELPAILEAVEQPWVLALDQVQDPHNLGACLRTAAAAGVSAVIAPRKRAAGLSPAVRKVAAGAAERVPFVPVTNLARALGRLQTEGYWVVGLDAQAPALLYDTALPERLVLVAGGEAGGLRALTQRQCDGCVAIPMAADVESLNVSVATGITLFEAVRQRAMAGTTSTD